MDIKIRSFIPSKKLVFVIRFSKFTALSPFFERRNFTAALDIKSNFKLEWAPLEHSSLGEFRSFHAALRQHEMSVRGALP
jgi:hypothetical protein